MANKEHAVIRHQEIGTTFEGVYYVESAFIKQTVQKKDFTDLMLRDKSGSRNVKYWGRVDGVAKGDFVFIAAHVDEYLGNPSVVAKNIEKVDEPETLEDYIPQYDSDGALNYAERFDVIKKQLEDVEGRVGNLTASVLISEVYGNATFFDKFMNCPGSTTSHYGRQGGLLANVVRVAEACLEGAVAYKLTDKEIVVLIASSLLMRVGAVETYEFQDCMPVMTKRGILLGINNLSMARIASALRRTVTTFSKNREMIDQDIAVRIMHAVTAHSGTDVKPMTKEAMILNYEYETDAKIVDALDFIETDINKGEEFTSYDPSMKRKYYTGPQA